MLVNVCVWNQCIWVCVVMFNQGLIDPDDTIIDQSDPSRYHGNQSWPSVSMATKYNHGNQINYHGYKGEKKKLSVIEGIRLFPFFFITMGIKCYAIPSASCTTSSTLFFQRYALFITVWKLFIFSIYTLLFVNFFFF